jgi:hypothetical protein
LRSGGAERGGEGAEMSAKAWETVQMLGMAAIVVVGAVAWVVLKNAGCP